MIKCYRKSALILIFASLVCTGIALDAGLAQGQMRTYADHIQSDREIMQGHTLLSNTIDLSSENITLIDALYEIAHQAGFRLSYDTELTQLETKIQDVHMENVTAEEALWTVLEGSGLRFSISANGQLVLFPVKVNRYLRRVQTGSLTGWVVDAESGETMPGANVYIPDTGQGTSTDVNGEFRIFDIEAGTYEVQVTFISYEQLTEDVEISGGETTAVKFELHQRRSQLDEIVVTGYGVRREVPTGAVTTVSAQSFEVRSVQTLDQVIQAQSPGFRMVSLSGQPGADSYIRIRGVGSINADSPPVFIIDGVKLESSNRGVMASSNILGSLNPTDIESVEVLRDAEATALYGADGANGVVLITTKRGQAGDTQFSVSSQIGVSEQTFKYDLMTGPEWLGFMQEVQGNRYKDLGQTVYNGVDYGDPIEAGRQAAIAIYGHPDAANTYDWQSAVMQPGFHQRLNISAQGGTDITQFYISGGFNDQEGTFIGSSFNRMSLRANIGHRVSEKFRFELNTNLARSKGYGQVEEEGFTSGSNLFDSPFFAAPTTSVITPIYNDNGTWNLDIPSGNANIVQLLNEHERSTRTAEIISNLSAIYNITENLGIRSRWGVNFRTVRDYRYRNPSIERYAADGGYVEEHNREVTSWNTDQVLDYFSSFRNVHNVNAILGLEYHHMYGSQFFALGRDLPSAHFYKTIDATGINHAMGGSFGEYKKAGVLSRITYNYDNRYYITANVRYDGSSRFGENKQWGLFYSSSLAWDIAREPFLADNSIITELKPRISYGITGNSGIGYYASQATFTTGGLYGESIGLRPGQLGNSNLTWETARSLDIGFDWSLFDGRIYGIVDVYRKDNEDLLLNRNLPTNSGYSSIADNVGTVRFEGIEMELGAVLIRKGEFTWSFDFNLTFERSEVLELADGQESVTNGVRVGHPRNIRWGRSYAGVNPADGRPMWYDADGELTYIVTDADLGPIGSQLPDYYGGLSNRFTYGPVALNVLFHYEYGKDLRNYTHNIYMMQPHRGPRTLSQEMFNRWQQPGDITQIPRAYSQSSFPGSSTYNALSTLDMEDGSFIRLKNVMLSYQLPLKWLEVLGLRGGSVYLQGENLLTWTAFKGPDPEVPADTRHIYPKPRTMMGGFKIDF